MSALRDALRNLPDTVFADLLASDDTYLLVIDLPGVVDDGVTVRAETGRLHVDAQRTKAPPDEFRYCTEERPLFLDFDLPIPPDATADDASASLDRGVLEIRLPRSSGGREIPVEH